MPFREFIASLNPEPIIADFAIKSSINAQGGVLTCSFTFDEQAVYVLTGNYFIRRGEGYTPTLSCIDIVALTYRAANWDTTYDLAVKLLISKYGSIIPDNFKSDHVATLIAKEALRHRKLLNVLMPGINTKTNLPGNVINTQLYRTQSTPKGVVFLTQEHLGKLNDILIKLDVKPLPPTVTAVIPYFANGMEVAALRIFFKSRTRIVWLTDHAYAYSNFFYISPVTKIVNDSLLGTEFGNTHLEFNPKGTTPPHIFKTLQRDPSCNELNYYLELSTLRTAGTVIMNSGVQDWEIRIAEAVLQFSTDALELDANLKLLLEGIRHSSEQKQFVIDGLKYRGDYHLAESVEQYLRSGFIVDSRSWRIYETQTGYKCEDKKLPESGQMPISNFTLSFKYSVKFGDQIVMYVADMHLNSEVYEVSLFSDDLSTVKNLEEALQKAIWLTGAKPAIFDASTAKLLLPYFRKQLTELPDRVGITSLGWEPSGSVFNGTWFRCDKDLPDVEYAPMLLYPSSAYMRYFIGNKEQEIQCCDTYTDSSPELLTIIHQCAAIIARSKLNYDNGVIPLLNTSINETTMLDLFSVLGQESVVELSRDVRSNGAILGIRGYPFVSRGYNRIQMLGVKTGMFMLGETGIDLSDVTELQLRGAKQYLLYIVTRIAKYGDLIPYTFSSEKPSPEVLAMEGSALCAQLEAVVSPHID